RRSMKSPSSALTRVRRLTSWPSSCMSRNSMLPDRSTASIMSRPLVAAGSASPSNWGRAAASTSSSQTSSRGQRRPGTVLSPASGRMLCSLSMNVTCRAAERVCAGGSQRRYTQGSGSRRKQSGQANSRLFMAHPYSQFPQQGITLLGGEAGAGLVKIGSKWLQRLAVAARTTAQVVQPGFAEQAGGMLFATLSKNLLEMNIDLGQPLAVRQSRRYIGEGFHAAVTCAPAVAPAPSAHQPGAEQQRQQHGCDK